MGPQTFPKRWGQILISLVILTASCIPGMEAVRCGGRCGPGTFCKHSTYCVCRDKYAALRRIPGTTVRFCSQKCGTSDCPDKTTCEVVFLQWTKVIFGYPLCECSHGTRLSPNGQCVDTVDDECGGRCGHRASCLEGGRCGCNEDSDVMISFGGRSVQFCVQKCETGEDACPANTTCGTSLPLAKNKRRVNLCMCSAGATRADTGQCLDIDECAQTPGICGNNSVCSNTDGNYTCACAEGYRESEGEKVGCSQDIDECGKNPGVCGNNSVCMNTEGSYRCSCVEGYKQRDGEVVGCSQDIDECTENTELCGNNSVCTNTVGNYTCACAEGYMRREGEEFGCIESVAASTAADSSPMTIGLAVGTAGVLLLAVIAVVVVVVVRARNRSRAGAGEEIGLDTQVKRSKVTEHAYENVADQQQRRVNNPTYPTLSVLPDVLSASSHSMFDRYEKVDLPPQTGQENDPGTLYSLARNIDEWEPNESSKYNDLYSNNEIADNKRKQLAAKKCHVSETSPSDSTYNALSKPYVKPSAAADNTPDNYTTLYDIHLKTTNERPGDPQTGHGSPHGKGDVEYDTTYSVARQSEEKSVPQTRSDQQNGSEYDELNVERV